MEKIKNLLIQTFTGKDNNTLDIGRILWALGVFVFFALSIHAVWRGQVFDAIAWGTGFGAVLAGGGVALKVKETTEPPPKDTTNGTSK